VKHAARQAKGAAVHKDFGPILRRRTLNHAFTINKAKVVRKAASPQITPDPFSAALLADVGLDEQEVNAVSVSLPLQARPGDVLEHVVVPVDAHHWTHEPCVQGCQQGETSPAANVEEVVQNEIWHVGDAQALHHYRLRDRVAGVVDELRKLVAVVQGPVGQGRRLDGLDKLRRGAVRHRR
jgi:hypothetical protein